MTCPLVSVKQSISQDRLGTNTGKKKVEGKGAFFAGPCVTDYTAWNSSACMPDETVQVRKTASFFEFSLCLSRACLGKMIVFRTKWLKNAVFRRRFGFVGRSL